MKSIGFKLITEENWLLPDEVSRAFSRLSSTGEAISMQGLDWLKLLLQPVLNANVPEEIRRLYEVARGTLAYGWFFYPLYTLGLEQLTRVGEASLTVKCLSLEAPKNIRSYANKINWLAEKLVIHPNDIGAWHALRQLRNIASHPASQSIYTPGNAVRILGNISQSINALFP